MVLEMEILSRMGAEPRIAALLAQRRDPAGFIGLSRFPAVFAGHRRKPFRESNVFVDGRRGRAIEPQRSIFFFHLDDRETCVRVTNERLETEMLERCYLAGIFPGSVLREKSRH